MKVSNMVSNSGNTIANQFLLVDSEGREWFQSYDSMIAVKGLDGVITLDKRYWDFSTTTGKYRNIFLNEKKSETQKKINSGEYTLADLN